MNREHDHETIKIIDRLKGHWVQEGLKTRPGASQAEIGAFEERYSVRLPPDLRTYFAMVDGMAEGETDANMFSFLPLKAVKCVSEELAHFGGIPDYTGIMQSLPDPHHWFVIVDYLIASAVFAIRLHSVVDETPVFWIGSGKEYQCVAGSFSEFVEIYFARPLSLVQPSVE